jgi:hypothetical protein
MTLIIKQIIHQIDSHLDSILKVPIELYLNKSNDLSFVYNFINAKNIFCYLNKNLCSIDLMAIFTEVMKEPSFDFEKFMMQPKFYSVFSIYLQRLFILFANVNNMFNLEIPSYRGKLLINLDEIKEKYTMHTWDSIYFSVLINFFEKFLNLINLKVPVVNEENLKIEKILLDEKMNEIKCRVNFKLKELMDLFLCTGLGHYMSRDENLISKFESRVKLDKSKEEYLVLSNVDNLELEEVEDKSSFSFDYLDERKEYHIKMKYMVDYNDGKIRDLYEDKETQEGKIKINESDVGYLGRKTERREEINLEDKKKEIEGEEKNKNEKIFTENITKLFSLSNKKNNVMKSKLNFTPQVVTFKI